MVSVCALQLRQYCGRSFPGLWLCDRFHVLRRWEDVKSAAFPESHVEFFGNLERLTGTPPIVAFAGHAESRGIIEMCSPEITNIVRTSASGNRLSSIQLVPSLACFPARLL